MCPQTQNRKRFVGRSFDEWNSELKLKAATTRQAYQSAMLGYLEYANTDTEKLFNEHLENCKHEDPRDKNIVPNNIRDYYLYLVEEKGYSKSHSKQILKAAKLFFKANELPFNVEQNGEKFSEVANGSKITQKNEISLMVEGTTNIQHKFGVLLLKDTGLRVSDAVQVNFEHVKDALIKNEKYCIFELVQKKVNVLCKPCIGPETMRYLREWIEFRQRRGETLDDDSPIFITTDKKTKKRKRMRARRLSQIVFRLGKKLKLKKKTAHSLRKYNTTNLQASGLHPAWISILQGKAIPGSWKEYSKPTDEQLLDAYMNGYKHIAIYQHTSEVNGLRHELRQTEEWVTANQAAFERMEKENAELRERLEKMEAYIKIIAEGKA